jgi:hypothetical protein
LDRIGIYFGGTDVQTQVAYQDYFDEFRMGDSFAAVTGVSDDQPIEWAGYPWADANGTVDTGSFLGTINVALAPWIHVDSLNRYVYADEAGIAPSGGWIYIYR